VTQGAVVLRTVRLVLREFTAADAAFVVALVNDPDWLRFIGERNVRTDDDARQFIAEQLVAKYRSQGFGLWAMQRQDDGALLGMCGLVARATLADIDLGYALLPQHRGAGYVREAAAACLDHAARVLGLPRVVAITRPDNAASIRVLQSLGMLHEDTLTLPGTTHTTLLFGWAPPR
jgi:RimJ/RimL family protein N-acetyltransferase